MATNFFTADTHFGHENIIKYCNRPFKNVNHMDETLIRNWNQRVKLNDTVYVLGDFCFKGGIEGGTSKSIIYQSLLNGKIIFIKGNHDNNNSTNAIIESAIIKHGGKRIFLVHRPQDALSGRFVNCQFVGHIHNEWKIKMPLEFSEKIQTPLINVGVDVWNFMPVTINEIFAKYKV